MTKLLAYLSRLASSGFYGETRVLWKAGEPVKVIEERVHLMDTLPVEPQNGEEG